MAEASLKESAFFHYLPRFILEPRHFAIPKGQMRGQHTARSAAYLTVSSDAPVEKGGSIIWNGKAT
jgi:hypothetical protein